MGPDLCAAVSVGVYALYGPGGGYVRLENGQLAEHWDVIREEATKEASVSGLPMFGDKFPG
jgi:hypothetical protein